MNAVPRKHVQPSLHPLEVFAPLRRWPASPLRNLVYTFVWNCLVGLFLALAEHVLAAHPDPLPVTLPQMLLGANVVGFLIHGGLATLYRLVPQAAAVPGMRERSAQVAICALGTMAGIALTRVLLVLLSGGEAMQALRSSALAMIAVYAVFITLLMRLVLSIGERRIARETQAARQQEHIAEAGRLLAEARLRALQAQIEPHFLYNTLANVLSLIDSQPAQARHMLERFIDYLRASLAASRAEHATLGGEIDQVRAYLDVLAVRLGARLRYRFALDPAAAMLPIAPMLLQPLVENAIMHGIEPKLEGGEIVVRTRLDGDLLCVEVIDTGCGLGSAPPRPGGGVGLSNLRERVRQLHGPDARLQLLENQPCGVISRLLLPLDMVPPSNTSTP